MYYGGAYARFVSLSLSVLTSQSATPKLRTHTHTHTHTYIYIYNISGGFGNDMQSNKTISLKVYLMAILDNYMFRPILVIFRLS